MVCGVEGDARPNPLRICVCARRVQGNCPCTRSQSSCLGLNLRVKEAKQGEDDLTIVFPVKNYAYWCPQIQNWYLGPKWLFLTAPGFEPKTRRCQVRRP